MSYTWPEDRDLTVKKSVGIGTDTPTQALEVKGKIQGNNQAGQPMLQLDAESSSLQISHPENPSACLLGVAEKSGYVSLNNQNGTRSLIKLFAESGGEKGVIQLFNTEGNSALQLSPQGVSCHELMIINESNQSTAVISSNGFARLDNLWANTINTNTISANQFGWITANGLNTPRVSISSTGGTDAGFIQTVLANGQPTIRLTTPGNSNAGYLAIYGNDGLEKISLQGWETRGFIGLIGDNGQQNVWLNGNGSINTSRVIISNTVGTGAGSDAGFIQTVLANGQTAIRLTTPENSNAGFIGLYGDNGQPNVWLNGNGFIVAKTSIQLVDDNGNPKLWLDKNGKNFVMSHPLDDSKNIIYAALEGPETAAYIRGQGKLKAGYAEIEFPEHFQLVINPDTLTIQLTPCSGESKGLAVVNQTANGFSVQELWQGKGEYGFYYLATAVRRGLEHFNPVVNKGLTAFGEPMNGGLATDREGSFSVASVPATSVMSSLSNVESVAETTGAEPELSPSVSTQSMALVDLPTVSFIPSPSLIRSEE